MKKQNLLLALFFLIALLFVISCAKSAAPSQYDNFAKCLTDKEAKMYGAYWCSHCNNQKELFGASFQYVDYTECSLPDNSGQTQICMDANIKAYPTWEFGDGSRMQGELTLAQLSQKSGCSLS